MTYIIGTPPTSRFSAGRAAALTLSVLFVLSTVVASAAADNWNEHQGWHGEHHGWHNHGDNRYYPAPPIIYDSPYYYPPPVVYGPGVGIRLPGLNLNFR